ncbi:MAG: acetyl-CoA acetyltransferase [Solirubrobacterales bacterium]|nr:acetyl-CoA acetyltransferase [Solirubrobacterales bacterium]
MATRAGRESFIVGAVRTPNGRYGGALTELPVVQLGAYTLRAVLERAGVPADAVDEVVFSNCRQAGNGPNPGRQVVMRAELPERVPAQTINMACASGLKSVALADDAVRSGAAEIAVAVAAESMSRMPYFTPYNLRWQGQRRGDIVLYDGWRDGGTDPICDMNMGETAELISERYGIEREAQDAWSARSHARVAAAWASGRFADEVVPVDAEWEGNEVRLERDETFREDSTPEKLAKLRPSFKADGTVTAGNASQMADGGASVIVASGEAVEKYGLTPIGVLRSFAAVGVEPAVMGVGPVEAIPKALAAAEVVKDDVDLFEINEAFAAQIVHNVRELGLDEERTNVNGGGIALGHPTGQTGCRLVVSVLGELGRRGESLGVASLCVGGGQGVAAVLERVS